MVLIDPKDVDFGELLRLLLHLFLIEWILAIAVLLLDLDQIVHDDGVASEFDLLLGTSPMVMLMNKAKHMADLVKDGTLAEALELR